jgi:transposase-like protein
VAGQGDDLESEAKRLRRAGRTIRAIKAELGVTSNRVIGELLRGEPPNPAVYAGRAKRDVQEQARALREQGMSYNAIAAELGVAKSSGCGETRRSPRCSAPASTTTP